MLAVINHGCAFTQQRATADADHSAVGMNIKCGADSAGGEVLAQQAAAMIRHGEVGRIFAAHGSYLQDWMLPRGVR